MNRRLKQLAIIGLVGLSVGTSVSTVKADEVAVQKTAPIPQIQEIQSRNTGNVTTPSFQIGDTMWATNYNGLKAGYTYTTKVVLRYSRNGVPYSSTVLHKSWTQQDRTYHGYSNYLPSTMNGKIQSGDKMDVYLYYNGVTLSKQTFSAR